MEFDMPVDNDDDYSQLPKSTPAKKEAEPAPDEGGGTISTPEANQFSNEMFDGPVDEDDDEPVGHRVPEAGEVIWNDKIFSEEEMHKKYFEGRNKRATSRLIQAIFSVSFALMLGGLGWGMFGDNNDIHHNKKTNVEVEEDAAGRGETFVINPATITGLVLGAIGGAMLGFFYLGKGWTTAEDWGYIDIAL